MLFRWLWYFKHTLYADGYLNEIALIMGVTIWWVAQWVYGPAHDEPDPIREPFITNLA